MSCTFAFLLLKSNKVDIQKTCIDLEIIWTSDEGLATMSLRILMMEGCQCNERIVKRQNIDLGVEWI